MRLNVLVLSLLPEGGTLVDRTGAGRPWPDRLKVSDGPLDQVGADALIAVSLDEDADADDIEAAVAGVGRDNSVMMLLSWQPHSVPVGRLVLGLVAAGMQIVDVHPLSDPPWGTAVVARRVDDDVEAMHAYLDPRRDVAKPQGRALLRLVNEHLVESFVWRSFEMRLRTAESERDVARADVEQLTRDLAATRAGQDALRRQLARVRASRSYRLARLFAATWRAPARLVRKLFR